jgi:hypothetical protein
MAEMVLTRSLVAQVLIALQVAGNDQFVFNFSNEGIDTITDFNVTFDSILISASGFGGGLVPGTLPGLIFYLVLVLTPLSTQPIGLFTTPTQVNSALILTVQVLSLQF